MLATLLRLADRMQALRQMEKHNNMFYQIVEKPKNSIFKLLTHVANAMKMVMEGLKVMFSQVFYD